MPVLRNVDIQHEDHLSGLEIFNSILYDFYKPVNIHFHIVHIVHMVSPYSPRSYISQMLRISVANSISQ